MSRKHVNTGTAMLQPGRQATSPIANNTPQIAQLPMLLTLDQLRPNPDNPRTKKNPRYEEIKESVREKGLLAVPLVTRDPDSDVDYYIFSAGGNTRYQILTELWQETQDERFYRVNVLCQPWPGRLACVVNHLAENEIRGENTFIEKARGIKNARDLYEAELGRNCSLRELSALLKKEGLPVHYSTISRMEDTLKYLAPFMPELLESGLGRPQILSLLSIRHDAWRVWQQYASDAENSEEQGFSDVFGDCCKKFDSPDLWSAELFRDELIGDLLQALSHPELDYDRWLMELDPQAQQRRILVEEQQRMNESVATASHELQTDDVNISIASGEQSADNDSGENSEAEKLSRIEVQPDIEIADSNSLLMDSVEEYVSSEDMVEEQQESQEIADVIWTIPSIRDDIEHLQNEAYQLAWAIAEQLGCEDEIQPARETAIESGYCVRDLDHCSDAAGFLASLTGVESLSTITINFLLIGNSNESSYLDDDSAIKLLQLIRVLRRLRELQRNNCTDLEDADDE